MSDKNSDLHPRNSAARNGPISTEFGPSSPACTWSDRAEFWFPRYGKPQDFSRRFSSRRVENRKNKTQISAPMYEKKICEKSTYAAGSGESCPEEMTQRFSARVLNFFLVQFSALRTWFSRRGSPRIGKKKVKNDAFAHRPPGWPRTRVEKNIRAKPTSGAFRRVVSRIFLNFSEPAASSDISVIFRPAPAASPSTWSRVKRGWRLLSGLETLEN